MKYIFTSQFLKIRPPETSFGDAWESFCEDLLSLEFGREECLRLKAPDRGVDILMRATKKAVQCKSDERGAFGTISPSPSLESLSTANTHRKDLGWNDYCFATNADYSGNGLEQILMKADALKISRKSIMFHGPKYWSDLCEKHFENVSERLDYRLKHTEEEVIDAFKKARYFEDKVKEYEELIKNDAYDIEIRNNRTPLRLQIPFSPSLTIKHCIDVAMQLLNLNMNAVEYPDLGTSARPSYSITIDRAPQGFSKKLSDYSEDELSKLQLWIKIIWNDEEQEDTRTVSRLECMKYTLSTRVVSQKNKGRETISRFETTLQDSIWGAISS